MEKMREEFEAWVCETFDIDCSEMSFGPSGSEGKEQYIKENNSYGAAVVSAMFYAWKASRAALCVDLPENCKGMALSVDEFHQQLNKAGVSYK